MRDLLRNRWVTFGLCLGFIFALGVVDYRTSFELDLFLIYALPVAITAWSVGRLVAVLTAIVSVAVWFSANLLGDNPYSSWFYKYWKTAIQCGWLLTIALMVSRIRTDLDRELKHLRGLLPICAWCKKLRTDEGYWEEVDTYLRKNTNAQFTHGICPACKQTLLSDLTEEQR